MPVIVVFDELATPQKVLQVLRSANEGPFLESARTDYVIEPDLSLLEGIVPQRYWKHSAGSIVEYTTQEKTDQDAAEAVAQTASMRSGGQTLLDEAGSAGILIRALAEIIRREINILRALHALPDRTLVQLRNAIDAEIDSGNVDT